MFKRAKIILALTLLPVVSTTAGCSFSRINKSNFTISLNFDNVKLGNEGVTSRKLIPTVETKTDKPYKVIWSSSNNDIASVDQTGSVNAVSPGTATITASINLNEKVNATCKITVLDKPYYDYTVMFYMCGSNLEQSNSGTTVYPGLFTKDIKEMLTCTYTPTTKVIIETGGTTKWGMSSSYLSGANSISASRLQRWEVCDNKLKFIETLDTNNMASQDSYQSFLEWGLRDYEAEQMGVVISGHGGGMQGCAFDDNMSDKGLDTSETSIATKNALEKYGREKMTWMGYDCCLMNVADIASVNAQYFDYMVASQETEVGTGWNHDMYIPTLTNNPLVSPEELLPEICDSFVRDNHNDRESQPCLQTLSVIDLREMNKFITILDNFVIELKKISNYFNIVKTALNNSLKFGQSYNLYLFGVVDFVDLLTKMKAQNKNLNIEPVVEQINKMVIANSYCSKYSTTPCGMSAFVASPSGYAYYPEGFQVSKSNYNSVNHSRLTEWQQLMLSNWLA